MLNLFTVAAPLVPMSSGFSPMPISPRWLSRWAALGVTVNKPSELASALDAAFASGKPAVVDVKTHVEGIAPRAWMPN